MLEIDTIPERKSTRLTFSGNLSVAEVAELQQQLLKTPWETETLEIVVDRVENVDLSFLQLAFAWAKTLKQSGKNLIFDFRLEGEFQRIFEESGFAKAFHQI